MASMETPDLRTTLAANLRRRIEADTPKGQRVSLRAWALWRNLDVRMIDRLVKGQHAVTLDKLQEVADACGLKPWHLLYEELDPESPPDAPVSESDRAMLRKLRRLLGDPPPT
jgi:hypothetical protein